MYTNLQPGSKRFVVHAPFRRTPRQPLHLSAKPIDPDRSTWSTQSRQQPKLSQPRDPTGPYGNAQSEPTNEDVVARPIFPPIDDVLVAWLTRRPKREDGTPALVTSLHGKPYPGTFHVPDHVSLLSMLSLCHRAVEQDLALPGSHAPPRPPRPWTTRRANALQETAGQGEVNLFFDIDKPTTKLGGGYLDLLSTGGPPSPPPTSGPKKWRGRREVEAEQTMYPKHDSVVDVLCQLLKEIFGAAFDGTWYLMSACGRKWTPPSSLPSRAHWKRGATLADAERPWHTKLPNPKSRTGDTDTLKKRRRRRRGQAKEEETDSEGGGYASADSSSSSSEPTAKRQRFGRGVEMETGRPGPATQPEKKENKAGRVEVSKEANDGNAVCIDYSSYTLVFTNAKVPRSFLKYVWHMAQQALDARFIGLGGCIDTNAQGTRMPWNDKSHLIRSQGCSRCGADDKGAPTVGGFEVYANRSNQRDLDLSTVVDYRKCECLWVPAGRPNQPIARGDKSGRWIDDPERKYTPTNPKPPPATWREVALGFCINDRPVKWTAPVTGPSGSSSLSPSSGALVSADGELLVEPSHGALQTVVQVAAPLILPLQTGNWNQWFDERGTTETLGGKDAETALLRQQVFGDSRVSLMMEWNRRLNPWVYAVVARWGTQAKPSHFACTLATLSNGKVWVNEDSWTIIGYWANSKQVSICPYGLKHKTTRTSAMCRFPVTGGPMALEWGCTAKRCEKKNKLPTIYVMPAASERSFLSSLPRRPDSEAASTL